MSDDIADKMPDLPYDQLIQWCVDVRLGTIKATPEVRARAKALTFAMMYGVPGKFEKIVP